MLAIGRVINATEFREKPRNNHEPYDQGPVGSVHGLHHADDHQRALRKEKKDSQPKLHTPDT